MRKIAMVFCLVALGVVGDGSFAQEAAKGGAPGASEGNRHSSRGKSKDEYIDEAKAQWGALEKAMEASGREKDPFGLAMDPGLIKEEPVVVAAVVEEEKVVVPEKVVSLQDAVDKFQVNGVNAAKQMVMVGFRSLRRGDPVEIEHEGELFKLRIVKITVNEVVFMNTKNQQTASVRLGVRKAIMGPGKEKGNLKDNMVKPGSTFKLEE